MPDEFKFVVSAAPGTPCQPLDLTKGLELAEAIVKSSIWQTKELYGIGRIAELLSSLDIEGLQVCQTKESEEIGVLLGRLIDSINKSCLPVSFEEPTSHLGGVFSRLERDSITHFRLRDFSTKTFLDSMITQPSASPPDISEPDISPFEQRLLDLLSQELDLTDKEAAQKLCVCRQTINRHRRKLEQLGYLVRCRP